MRTPFKRKNALERALDAIADVELPDAVKNPRGGTGRAVKAGAAGAAGLAALTALSAGISSARRKSDGS